MYIPSSKRIVGLLAKKYNAPSEQQSREGVHQVDSFSTLQNCLLELN